MSSFMRLPVEVEFGDTLTTVGEDEIGAMTGAVQVFKDNAVRMQALPQKIIHGGRHGNGLIAGGKASRIGAGGLVR